VGKKFVHQRAHVRTLRAHAPPEVEDCKIHGALSECVPKVQIGALLDKKIHHDALFVQTGRVHVHAPLLLQGEAVLQVKFCQVDHLFLVGVFPADIMQHDAIERGGAALELHVHRQVGFGKMESLLWTKLPEIEAFPDSVGLWWGRTRHWTRNSHSQRWNDQDDLQTSIFDCQKT